MTIPEELKDKIKRLANLPTLPRIACAILDKMNNPYVSTPAIASIVSQDISLSAKILRLSNSAFYGIPRTIADLNEAIVILGFNVVYTMVLSLTVFDMFPGEQRSSRFDRQKFWKHSLICGCAAKMIAECMQKKSSNPDEAFCAGLLHDIGKIVMEQYLHDDMHNAIDYGNKCNIPVYEAEQTLLGYTHADVSEWLISQWNLPDILSLPIIYHHTPEKNGASLGTQKIVRPSMVQTCLCHIADYISHDTGITGAESTVVPPPLNQECIEFLGFSEQHIETIKKAIPEKIKEMAVFHEIFVA